MPTRDHIYAPDSVGARAADRIATSMGSWRFVILQSAVIVLWITVNVVAVGQHFDPYPFILLNLLFSTQAAYASPLIMMSQNRQAEKDRHRDDQEAQEVDTMTQEMRLLKLLNEQQLALLHLLHDHAQEAPQQQGNA